MLVKYVLAMMLRFLVLENAGSNILMLTIKRASWKEVNTADTCRCGLMYS